MRKAIYIAVIVAATGYGLLWALNLGMRSRLNRRDWPDGLGTLLNAEKHFPDAEETLAAVALMRLTPSLGIDTTPRTKVMDARPTLPDAVKKAFGDYDKAELESARFEITAPPAIVSEYLQQHDTELNAVRDHVLTGGPIGWKVRFHDGFAAPLPNLLGDMLLAKVFVARSFVKAKVSDPSAWDDLRTVWLLNRGLWQRPELISQLIALAATRMVNGAAAKMPLPAPAWLGEMRSYDYRFAFLASQQAEAWMGGRQRAGLEMEMSRGSRVLAAIIRPYAEICGADYAEKMRVRTTEVARRNACDYGADPLSRAPIPIGQWNIFGRIMMAIPGPGSAWHRFHRFRAELEATEKALALRSGRVPSTTTRCSDGTWKVTGNSIEFSRDIPVQPPTTKFRLSYAAMVK
jgi:hypothetical protein